jgi:ABC-type sugar transport system permease subunit
VATNRKGLWRQVCRNRHFYLFVSPFFILFAVFGLYPLAFSLVLSFARWDGLTELRWVGFANFSAVLTDEFFYTSLWNTLAIGFLSIPPMLLAAFALAVLLNTSWIRMRTAFRAAIFLPCVTPMVVVALVFTLLYGHEFGLINYFIVQAKSLMPFLPIEPVPWLLSETWSKPAVALLLIWRWTGYFMVLMMAGLQGIPPEYYDAARIDGAGTLQRMRFITLPLMRPVFIFCGILSLIGTVYMFDEVFVLTQGGPGISSMNFGLYLFNTSFVDFKFGYASCMAYLVAVVVFFASLAILKYRREEGNS